MVGAYAVGDFVSGDLVSYVCMIGRAEKKQMSSWTAFGVYICTLQLVSSLDIDGVLHTGDFMLKGVTAFGLQAVDMLRIGSTAYVPP